MITALASIVIGKQIFFHIGREGWGKLAGGVMWPSPPLRYLTKEDGKTQVSSHLSLLELSRGKI